MTKPMKYHKRTRHKSYSETYSTIWNAEIPLASERKEFVNADSKRRNEVMQVYFDMCREPLDSLVVPWGC